MTDQPGFRGSALVVRRNETMYELNQGSADERTSVHTLDPFPDRLGE